MFSQRKAFHIFSQKKASLVFPKTEPCTFYSKPKNFKNPQEKDFSSPNIFFISPETEHSSSSIKKISHIFPNKSFSYISENGTLHFSVQSLKIKELHNGKIYYALGNGNPRKSLYFSKWKL